MNNNNNNDDNNDSTWTDPAENDLLCALNEMGVAKRRDVMATLMAKLDATHPDGPTDPEELAEQIETTINIFDARINGAES